jgi:hypothetical protein
VIYIYRSCGAKLRSVVDRGTPLSSRLTNLRHHTHSQHYQQFQTQPRLKASPIRLPKPTWSTIMQLKLAHGYFRSYLVRLPDYDDDSCPHCHGYYKQTPYHLLFKCQSHTGVRKKSIQKLDKRDQNLYNLFMTTEGQKKMAEFLQESKIATRQWILQAA